MPLTTSEEESDQRMSVRRRVSCQKLSEPIQYFRFKNKVMPLEFSWILEAFQIVAKAKFVYILVLWAACW